MLHLKLLVTHLLKWASNELNHGSLCIKATRWSHRTMWMFFKGSSISHCQIKTPMHFTSIYFLIPAMWSSGLFFPPSHTIYNLGKLRYQSSEWNLSIRCFQSINNLFYSLEVVIFDGLILPSEAWRNFRNSSYYGYIWLIFGISSD